MKFRILVAVAALCLSTMDLSRASAQPGSIAAGTFDTITVQP